MLQPLVSIVIPVFKVEEYLRQCLDSVLSQTVEEWECICIDDGSPDGSGAILDEYGARDARFKIIHKRNEGVSAARNLGMELASAPCLTFMDSDDWMEPDALECLLAAMKESRADMAVCSIFIHRENREDAYTETPHRPLGNLPECPVTNETFSGSSLVDVSVWAKLFKTETVKRNGIHFIPNLKVSEDMEFSTRMLCHSSRISIIPRPLYHYRAGHESSIMNNLMNGRMSTADFINSIRTIYHLYQCVPRELAGKERRERVTGTLRRALAGKTFYGQAIRRLAREDRAAILGSTSFPYSSYLRKGKKMTSLRLMFRHWRMQAGIGTRLQSLLHGIGKPFQS
ncbi:glycosyltransferase family 2 protein [Akkermansia muciniphila]|uniref:glycosyltransferase family 2 protein n=1 Tax=Akkermansia muciniphila TaxID=239935 RepID=UPI001BFF3A6F|nr:glycosyltransferase family 2 protein [Akkermansia muciniphila]MBT8778305.1 glycosyltransferase family 2 protein [Akkermansia muciniphila]